MVSAQAVLDIARNELGTVETAQGTKYSREYGLGADQPWCAVFVWWVFRQAGASSLIHPKTAYTPTLASWFMDRGAFDNQPRVGDLVFFNWPNDGVNRIQHVGIVESIERDAIVTIEGNTSTTSSGNGGQVMRRRRARNGSIVGYGHPSYGAAAPAAPPSSAAYPGGLPSLTYGMRNNPDVAALQAFLNAYDWRPALPLLPVTGNYLDQTVAVVKAAQAQMGVTGPDANGRDVGPRTNAALWARGYRGRAARVQGLATTPEPAPAPPPAPEPARNVEPPPMTDSELLDELAEEVAGMRQQLAALTPEAIASAVLDELSRRAAA